MPSVVVVGKRLAIFYDAPGGDSTSHMERDLGMGAAGVAAVAAQTIITGG